jgi:hypothetical protein
MHACLRESNNMWNMKLAHAHKRQMAANLHKREAFRTKMRSFHAWKDRAQVHAGTIVLRAPKQRCFMARVMYRWWVFVFVLMCLSIWGLARTRTKSRLGIHTYWHLPWCTLMSVCNVSWPASCIGDKCLFWCAYPCCASVWSLERTRMNTHLGIHTYIHTYIHTGICHDAHPWASAGNCQKCSGLGIFYVWIYIYIYIYIHTYTHAHTHTHTRLVHMQLGIGSFLETVQKTQAEHGVCQPW